MKTTTAREFLVGQGLAKAGRGKFSNAAKEELAKAIEAGTEFSDYHANISKDSTVVVESKEDIGINRVIEIAPMVHPNGTARFVKTGKKVSMSSACNSCGYSLSWCECASPRVYSKEVTISLK